MKNYSIDLNLRTIDKADVVVIGGGPSGVAAAIAAARNKKRVILIETSAQLGGMATLGGVAIYMPVGNFTGIFKELMTEFIPKQVEDALNGKDPWPFAFQFNPILFRHYLNMKMEREGVQVYYHTTFAKTIKDGNCLRAIVVNTREGLFVIEGKRFVDCTGDARVAIDAGANYTTGREEDHVTQPVTLMMIMQNTHQPVDSTLPEDCYFYETVEDLPQGRLLSWERCGDGSMLINMTRVKGNGARIEDINYFEKEALKQALSVANYLQRNGYPTYKLVNVAPQAGVRQTNQVEGLYKLGEVDIFNALQHADAVASTNYGIDIHSPDGAKTCDVRDVSTYDIPYRCMVPVGIENLLVSGRAISATHVAMSSARVMPTCYALGEAAGVAVALSIDKDCALKDIPIKDLENNFKKT
ncbi:MAG: FAD-dependent oxidoreductase [Clostridia bacterium]